MVLCKYMKMTARTMQDTQIFARNIVTILKRSGRERVSASSDENSSIGAEQATILTLSGPLGAGKTTLTKCIADILGVDRVVTSPSFVLRSDYTTTDPTFRNLIHIDAYRLTEQEVPTIGWEDVLTSPRTLVVIEWPERIAAHIPEYCWAITARAEGGVYAFTLTQPDTVANMKTV